MRGRTGLLSCVVVVYTIWEVVWCGLETGKFQCRVVIGIPCMYYHTKSDLVFKYDEAIAQ
jgi:hypothetical protein